MFDFLIRPFRRNFGIDKEYYRFVDDMFGFIPNNIELYKLALIHKSASQSIGGHNINNERLEFLGDAVIESVTSDYLYIEFPDQNEGFMTQLRAKIVSRQSLNDIARKIGLDKYVVYNSGGNFTQKHIYGDAFEAMMGAIYLDQGYEFVNRLLINNIYYKHLSIDSLTESETDFKSRLIEWCQKNRHSVVFRTRSDAHAPHTAPSFYSTVLIDGIEVGHGVGDSKKAAEQNAAASLSHEMSDEECAELLDKFDKITPTLENRRTEQKSKTKNEQKPKVEKGEKPKQRAEQKPKSEANTEPMAEPAKSEKGEKGESKTKAEPTEKEAGSEKPKRRRRSSKPKSETTSSVAAAEIVTADEPIAKSEPAEPAQKSEHSTKPKRTHRRRSSKPKSEVQGEPSANNNSTSNTDTSVSA